MLDLVGYTPEADLGAKVIVEPSCGCGAFLLPIVERLAESCAYFGRPLAEAGKAIAGFDLLDHNAEVARKAVEMNWPTWARPKRALSLLPISGLLQATSC